MRIAYCHALFWRVIGASSRWLKDQICASMSCSDWNASRPIARCWRSCFQTALACTYPVPSRSASPPQLCDELATWTVKEGHCLEEARQRRVIRHRRRALLGMICVLNIYQLLDMYERFAGTLMYLNRCEIENAHKACVYLLKLTGVIWHDMWYIVICPGKQQSSVLGLCSLAGQPLLACEGAGPPDLGLCVLESSSHLCWDYVGCPTPYPSFPQPCEGAGPSD